MFAFAAQVSTVIAQTIDITESYHPLIDIERNLGCSSQRTLKGEVSLYC
jgi:hypothetical protein